MSQKETGDGEGGELKDVRWNLKRVPHCSAMPLLLCLRLNVFGNPKHKCQYNEDGFPHHVISWLCLKLNNSKEKKKQKIKNLAMTVYFSTHNKNGSDLIL